MMRSICIAIVSFVALLAPSTTFSQTVLAGATAGTSSVSDSGAANYEIKLTLPPGVGDMIPDLSLRYASEGPDGLLGVGWTLNGLPAIRRCPKSFATDGAVQSIKLTRNDAICLEGERLVNANPADLQDGNSLEDNTEFRTERESFSRVI